MVLGADSTVPPAAINRTEWMSSSGAVSLSRNPDAPEPVARATSSSAEKAVSTAPAGRRGAGDVREAPGPLRRTADGGRRTAAAGRGPGLRRSPG
ncbi:hypothetical protein Snoj_71370 [Streptomyces nojiriensis]|uniref:Uncharacterized protein n=1 Tax=Streptomyces nojiriensis TaxID=66374 RepID=A0ABQ3SYK1_9ACTN|nr:hypothetical protein Snoj_71370 [Streptomyces nojiriensis]